MYVKNYNRDQQIIYVINGKNYVLIEEIILPDTDQEALNAKVKRHEGFFQGIEIKSPTFFLKGYAIGRVLIPETKIFDYCNELDKPKSVTQKIMDLGEAWLEKKFGSQKP